MSGAAGGNLMCTHHSDGCSCHDFSRFGFSRRGFLKVGAAAGFLGGLALPAFAQDKMPTPNSISPDEALKLLMDGNARYVANTSRNKDFSAERAARAAAQYPIAGLVSCADSRVSPEICFDQGLGDLFVVRLAGNFVHEDGLASLEYGVKVFVQFKSALNANVIETYSCVIKIPHISNTQICHLKY